MSQFFYKSIRIGLYTNPYCGRQWKRIFLCGVNSCLNVNRSKSFHKIISTDYCRITTNPSIKYFNEGNNFGRAYCDATRHITSSIFYYSLGDGEKRSEYSDKNSGECKVYHRKTKLGEYKVVVCKKDGPKQTENTLGNLPPDISFFKVLGAVTLTLLGIIVAAFSTVFFVSLAANVIVIISIISFFVICYRFAKYRWSQSVRRKK